MSYDIGQTIVCDHTDLNDLGELTTFDIDSCPKCLGTGYYYDFVFINGQVPTVENEELLEEQVAKHVLTSRGTSIYSDLGTKLLDYLAMPGSVSFTILKRRVEGEIREALSRFYLIQRSQEDNGQSVTDRETLYKIDSIEASLRSPRQLTVEVVLTNRAGRTVLFRL